MSFDTCVPGDLYRNCGISVFDGVLFTVLSANGRYITGRGKGHNGVYVPHAQKKAVYVFNKLPADQDRNQAPLQLCGPNTSKPFVSGYMRWNDIIEEIRIIQDAPVPEAAWQAFLDKQSSKQLTLE